MHRRWPYGRPSPIVIAVIARTSAADVLGCSVLLNLPRAGSFWVVAFLNFATLAGRFCCSGANNRVPAALLLYNRLNST